MISLLNQKYYSMNFYSDLLEPNHVLTVSSARIINKNSAVRSSSKQLKGCVGGSQMSEMCVN